MGHKKGFYEKYIKRPQDFLCALLACIVLSPVLLIVAILVRVKLGTPVPVTEGLQVIVDITSSDKNGLTGLVVDIDSPTLTPDELAGMGLASHLDLVNPGDLKTAIEGLGFPTGSNVLNQSKVTFDISNFMPLLGLLGAGTHNFIIKATDAQGTTTETLILVTE